MTTTPNAVAPATPFTTALHAEMAEAAANVFANLVEKVDRSRLPEPIFREHFLGFFTNNAPMSPQSQTHARWVGIAGSPTAEVDVFDQVTGDVLFTVPPIFSTESLSIVRSNHRGPSIKDIQLEYLRDRENLGPIAVNTYNAELARKADQIVPGGEPQSRDKENWAKIGTYYGLTTPQAAAAPVAVEEAPIEYD